LKVALLCPYSLGVPGGVQGQVLGLASELSALGHGVTVLAPTDGDRIFGATSREEARFEIVGLGRSIPVRANGSVAPVALGVTASSRALRCIASGGFDVLHFHEPLAPGASYACLVLRAEPKVGTFHRSGSSALYSVLRPIARPVSQRLAVRCAVSPQARDTAKAALGGEYELIPNGVDTERFASAQPWPTDAPTVFFVGRHERRKGLEVLLRAFRRLEDSGAVCWIAGHGPETAELKKRYPPTSRFQWLGRIDDDELARRLRGADVACFPALGGESFGVVLLEAMAAGTAVVASDIAGYRGAAGDFARFFTPGDSSALAECLRDALSQARSGVGPSSVAELERASKHASRWSMASNAVRYESVYSEALETRHRH
jgi:phosphatidyl-myo-inositol alpha-mannosyltransferase